MYLGLDSQIRHCVLAGMDSRGTPLLSERLPTSEALLVSHIVAIKARSKALVIVESSLAEWLPGALQDYLDVRIGCDPRQNALISHPLPRGHLANDAKQSSAMSVLRVPGHNGLTTSSATLST